MFCDLFVYSLCIQKEGWHREIKKARGATNLTVALTPRMKHNLQIAQMEQVCFIYFICYIFTLEIKYGQSL